MDRKQPILGAIMAALTLAACGGGAAPASPASSAGAVASKPAAASSAAPSTSGGPASTKPAASAGAAASGPAAARTPVLEVAKVPPGPPTPQAARIAAVPVSSRPPLPAKYSQPVGPYTMYMEVIASAAPSTAGLLAIPGCVVDSVFKRGMRVVFRYSIYDMSSGGKPITDRDGSTTKVQVAANQSVDGFFIPRGAPPAPPDAPWTWAGIWNVPTDFPLGDVKPMISLAGNGKTATINPADFGAMAIKIVD